MSLLPPGQMINKPSADPNTWTQNADPNAGQSTPYQAPFTFQQIHDRQTQRDDAVAGQVANAEQTYQLQLDQEVQNGQLSQANEANEIANYNSQLVGSVATYLSSALATDLHAGIALNDSTNRTANQLSSRFASYQAQYGATESGDGQAYSVSFTPSDEVTSTIALVKANDATGYANWVTALNDAVTTYNADPNNTTKITANDVAQYEAQQQQQIQQSEANTAVNAQTYGTPAVAYSAGQIQSRIADRQQLGNAVYAGTVTQYEAAVTSYEAANPTLTQAQKDSLSQQLVDAETQLKDQLNTALDDAVTADEKFGRSDSDYKAFAAANTFSAHT